MTTSRDNTGKIAVAGERCACPGCRLGHGCEWFTRKCGHARDRSCDSRCNDASAQPWERDGGELAHAWCLPMRYKAGGWRLSMQHPCIAVFDDVTCVYCDGSMARWPGVERAPEPTPDPVTTAERFICTSCGHVEAPEETQATGRMCDACCGWSSRTTSPAGRWAAHRFGVDVPEAARFCRHELGPAREGHTGIPMVDAGGARVCPSQADGDDGLCAFHRPASVEVERCEHGHEIDVSCLACRAERTGPEIAAGSAFVAVRRAGPRHDSPGAWLRMDKLQPEPWAPCASFDKVHREIAFLAKGSPDVEMGVMVLPAEHVVWTTSSASVPEQLRPPPASRETVRPPLAPSDPEPSLSLF